VQLVLLAGVAAADVEQGLLNQPFFMESEYIPLPLTCTRI